MRRQGGPSRGRIARLASTEKHLDVIGGARGIQELAPSDANSRCRSSVPSDAFSRLVCVLQEDKLPRPKRRLDEWLNHAERICLRVKTAFNRCRLLYGGSGHIPVAFLSTDL
jgi:hypothetical protein